MWLCPAIFRAAGGAAAFAALLVLLAVTGCSKSGLDRTATAAQAQVPGEKPMPATTTSTKLTVTSTAFKANQPIPTKHTGDGADASPALAWTGAPSGVVEYVLIVDDPDAPRPQPWVHWVIYKIPGSATSLPEGVEKNGKPAQPAGALQGKNSWDDLGYGGPQPPKGHGTHHYHFKLYALNQALGSGPGLTKEELLKAMKGHITAEGELIGTYERK